MLDTIILEGYYLQIGIRVYQLRIYNDHKSYKHLTGKHAQDVQAAIRLFVSKYKSNPLIRIASSDDGANGEKRSHRFLPMKDEINTQHGIVRYGTFGYGTDVEDVATGSIAHTRTTEQADTIPLYYRMWWPDGYSYGLFAFQSYSGKSCATAILSEIRAFYRDKFPDWRLEAKKIVHDEVAEYKNKPVKKISLVKPRTSATTVASALRPTNPQAEVDVTLEVTARGKGTFGKLGDLKGRLGGKMSIDGTDYTRAFATFSVNGKPKKVGIIGVSSNTGVIDVTDDVDLDPTTNMPTSSSISKAAKDEIKDFAVRLGK